MVNIDQTEASFASFPWVEFMASVQYDMDIFFMGGFICLRYMYHNQELLLSPISIVVI